MTSCSNKRKNECVGDCTWVVGKGCKKTSDIVKSPATKPPKSPKSPATKHPKSPKSPKADGCVKSDLKKYTSRNSPPYPAGSCRGMTLEGKDGMYTSVPDKNGVYKWLKIKAPNRQQGSLNASVNTSVIVTSKDLAFKNLVEIHNIPKSKHEKLLKNGIKNKAGINPKDWEKLSSQMIYLPEYGKMHEITLSDSDLEDFHMYDNLSMIAKYKKNTWKRGDVIVVEQEGGDRNSGKCMWNGKEVVPLDANLDDYGAISEEFRVGSEFSAHHWSIYVPGYISMIDHNQFVHVKFTPEIAKEINAFVKAACDRAMNKRQFPSFGHPDCEAFVFQFKNEKWAVVANFNDSNTCRYFAQHDALDKKGEGVLCYVLPSFIYEEELNKNDGIFVFEEKGITEELLAQGVSIKNVLLLSNE